MSGGVQIVGSRPNLMHGTILAGGTITAPIDLSEYSLVGLIAETTMTLGTLTFRVSSTGEGGTFVDLKDDAGAAIEVGPVSGTFAVSTVALAPLIAYRYVQVKTSVAQASGLKFTMPVRA